jgi:hypothetical protein
MKPPSCEICGAKSWGTPRECDGDYVLFANSTPSKPVEEIELGHPEGFEFFCDQHLPMAQALKHLKSDEAILRLRQETGLSPPTPVPYELPPSLFTRLLNKLGLVSHN